MRLGVNASPEPFSNIALCVLEDAGSTGLSLLAAFHPVVTLTIVSLFLLLGILICASLRAEFEACFGVCA